MASPDWEYQVENFDPAPDKELVCCICCCVFKDPVQSSCNHVFCRTCITKWLEKNADCPICRKGTYRYSLRDAIPLIKNMIMNLTLHCRNKDKGCDEKFPLESYEAHVRACKFEKVRCENRPCNEMILRKDKEDHEGKNCPCLFSDCKTCGMKIPLKPSKKPKHSCVLALKEENQNLRKIIKERDQEIKNFQDAADLVINISSMSSERKLAAGDGRIEQSNAAERKDSGALVDSSDSGLGTDQPRRATKRPVSVSYEEGDYLYVSNIPLPKRIFRKDNASSGTLSSSSLEAVAAIPSTSNGTASSTAEGSAPNTNRRTPLTRRAKLSSYKDSKSVGNAISQTTSVQKRIDAQSDSSSDSSDELTESRIHSMLSRIDAVSDTSSDSSDALTESRTHAVSSRPRPDTSSDSSSSSGSSGGLMRIQTRKYSSVSSPVTRIMPSSDDSSSDSD